MDALARAGYLVMAPNHKDAICEGNLGALGSARPEESFRDAESWNDQTYRDRHDDFSKLADALRRDARWAEDIDWSRIALAGHSLGGYTVLGLAGSWPTWKQPNVKAVLALSPYCEPYVLKGSLHALNIPVMYQGGTRDLGITPSVKKSGGCFAKTSSPAVLVEFEGAGHFAWSDLQGTAHDLIAEYSLAFLEKYVRGAETDLNRKRDGVRELRVK
jgi:predicted dienelactone hydrolase